MRIVIGVTGRAGSGKSTAADHLVERHRFVRVKFAGPLKDMMRALGLGEREIEGDLKEKPCDLLGGKTPRWAMQSIGTDWGRDMITPDLWVRAWHAACAKVPAGRGIIADDCRFPNEADAVRAAPFALVVRIERHGGTEVGAHASELMTFPADVTIKNSGTIDELKTQMDRLVLDASWAA
jgi:hypothetical protein